MAAEAPVLVSDSQLEELRRELADDRKKGHVRILVNADDGGLRAFLPRSSSFIVGPDGRFIGE